MSNPTAYPQTITDWRDLAALDPEVAVDRFLAALDALPPETKRAAIMWVPDRNALIAAFEAGVETQAPLAGVPYGLKDLFDFAGAPTAGGSGFLTAARPTPQTSCRVVNHLTEEGAVMAAKVATVEFAYGLSGENHWFGDCPHPYVPGALSGGSSSGSAWLVGRGLAPFAIGTDTAGSMRVPAAYCGLWAWRDIPGPLTKEGCFPLAPSFDTAGWFARSANELELLNDIFLGPAKLDTTVRVLDLTALSPSLSPELRSVGAALLDRFGAEKNDEAEAIALEAFEQGSQAYNTLGSCETYVIHEPWLDRFKERYDPVVWRRIDRGRNWSHDDIARARRKEAAVLIAWERLFAEFDVVAMPVTPEPSPGKATMTEDYRNELLDLTTPASLGRCPALTIPLPLPNGTSGGIQFVMKGDANRVSKANALLNVMG